MLRKILERTTGPLTDSEFEELIDLVNDDIQANRIAYNKRTGIKYVVYVAEVTFGILQRCRVA